jgi:hypothetical protein
MKTTWTRIKQKVTVAAVALVAVCVGAPAHALVYTPGDAVLVVYGNDAQGYLNLGSWNTLKASGGSFDVKDILNGAGVAGANPIQYAIVGNSGGNTPMWFGSNNAVDSWSSLQKTLLNVNAYNTANTSWRGQLTNANDAARQLYSSSPSDILSFTAHFGTTGNLAGLIPNGQRGSSDIDTILHLLERPTDPNSLAGITTAFLNSTTKLLTFGGGQPAPIPVPAAAILFATGMIGLVGFARRSMGLS